MRARGINRFGVWREVSIGRSPWLAAEILRRAGWKWAGVYDDGNRLVAGVRLDARTLRRVAWKLNSDGTREAA